MTSADVGDHVREVLRKIDPLDSLYFDVSVARHMLEEGDHNKALEWLDPNHALGELKKSQEAKFLTTSEADEVGSTIKTIEQDIYGGRISKATIAAGHLQNKLASKAYLAFKELDPIPDGYIDSRYEAAREKKVAEWRAKGYRPGLIEKALLWADEWSKGIAKRFIKDPVLRAQVQESLYPEALELSQKYIEAFAKS